MSSDYRRSSMGREPAVTFVIGLAGSGKSTLLNSLVYDVVFEECFWFDDNVIEENHAQVLELLKKRKHCVITERRFMQQYAREQYVQRLLESVPLLQVNWLCFENDLEAANHNCRSRTNKEGDIHGERHVEQNCRDVITYTIPMGAIVIKIQRWPGIAPIEAAGYMHSVGPERRI